jgi:hypothetical protein
MLDNMEVIPLYLQFFSGKVLSILKCVMFKLDINANL